MATFITHSQLVQYMRRAGVQPGQTVMLHISVKAVGDVLGGPNVIIQALLDVLGQDGTLMMYVGWHDFPEFPPELSPDDRQFIYEEHPVFDPATARAVRDYSVLAEFLRTWPGSQRSQNPEASMVAVGAQADVLTATHALDYGYGEQSPLSTLLQLNGKILVCGAPLDTITLLHYAENRARMRDKTIVQFECPVWRDGQKVWITMEDYDTGEPHHDYTFQQIADDYVTTHNVPQQTIGSAASYLLDANRLADFAIQWLETRFG